jgi:hypothetical protein
MVAMMSKSACNRSSELEILIATDTMNRRGIQRGLIILHAKTSSTVPA